mgnify:FL=1
MPFITEELWHLIENKREDYVINATYPKSDSYDNKINDNFDKTFDIVTSIRKAKSDNGIKQKEKISLSVINKSGFDYNNHKNLIHKLSKTENLKEIDKAKIDCPSFLSGPDTIFLEIKKSESSKEETLKQIEYLEGFLIAVNKKLSNKSFVNNAPKEVIEIEIKKKEDASIKLENLKKSI